MFSVNVRIVRPYSPASYFFLFLSLLSITGLCKASDLTLAVNLGLLPDKAAVKYQPLLRYLGQVTGQRIQLKAYPNALAHWETMRRQGFDMVLDNPAFTAYRVAKMNYTVIGKLPDVLSFTLVTHVDEMMFDPEELIGLKVASQPSPSITALRLDELFPNPMQQPQFIKAKTHAEALDLVVKRRVAGAMVPTGMIGNNQNMNPIYTSEQIPAPGFSVSAKVSPKLRQKIRQGLLNAHETASGRAMLEALNVPHFETATDATYAGMEVMLKGLYGY